MPRLKTFLRAPMSMRVRPLLVSSQTTIIRSVNCSVMTVRSETQLPSLNNVRFYEYQFVCPFAFVSFMNEPHFYFTEFGRRSVVRRNMFSTLCIFLVARLLIRSCRYRVLGSERSEGGIGSTITYVFPLLCANTINISTRSSRTYHDSQRRISFLGYFMSNIF